MGIGHTLTLLFFSSLVLLLGLVIPEQFAEALEFAVGLMLIGLGIDVFRRMSRERIHFHVHEHHNQPPHFHAHIHEPPDHHETASSHNHAHPKGFPLPSPDCRVDARNGRVGCAHCANAANSYFS